MPAHRMAEARMVFWSSAIPPRPYRILLWRIIRSMTAIPVIPRISPSMDMSMALLSDGTRYTMVKILALLRPEDMPPMLQQT
ncbi:hypothetical protein D3C81_1136140 [compost metagenome]